MATKAYGLRPGKAGGLSFQQLGQQAIDDQSGAGTNGLPTSPFAALPAPTGAVAQKTAPVERATINPAAIPQGFQFTGEFDAINRGLSQQESDAGLQRRNSLQAIADSFLQGTRKAETAHQQSRRKLFEALADRGALGSGTALEDVAEHDTSFNDYLNEIARAKAYDEANVENSYASVLNQLGRRREGLVTEQQKAEEARRLQQAETERMAEIARQEAESRRAQLQAIIDGQNAIRNQPVASYGPTVSYSPGGGGGGFQWEEPAPAPAPAAVAPNADIVAMPQNILTGGGVGGRAEDWVRRYVDPNASPQAVQQVISVLTRAGHQGVPRADLGWLVAQYPNQPAAPRQTAARRDPRAITARNR